jgi:hypothetical protein
LRVLLRRGCRRGSRWRGFLLRRGVMHVVMNVHVLVMMHVMAFFAFFVVHRRPGFFWRIGDRLHGHLGDRRSPYERRNCERRNGNAWKLHVVSLMR